MMRNFVVFFIIGLMGIAVAQEKADNVAADDISEGRKFDVPNVRNRRAGLSADKPGCTSITARAAYENVGTGQRRCLSENSVNFPGSGENNDYVAQLMAHCHRSDEFKNCLDKAVSDNKFCLYKQYNDIVRPRTESYKSALKFFCDRTTGADTCWNSKSQAKQQCNNSANIQMSGSDMSQTAAQCRRIELFQSCMADQLRTCEKPEVANVFNELMDATKMATPCSASAIANVLFVTVTTALLSMKIL